MLKVLNIRVTIYMDNICLLVIMRKVVFLIVVLIVLSYPIFLGTVFAAPAPWGIAINTQTEQCAGYWGGDEFTAYPLPAGWNDYYPDFSGELDQVVTPIGTCTFISEESCCEQLGYKYVSDNIGILSDVSDDEPLTGLLDPSVAGFLALTSCCCVLGIGFIAILIVVLTRAKKGASQEE